MSKQEFKKIRKKGYQRKGPVETEKTGLWARKGGNRCRRVGSMTEKLRTQTRIQSEAGKRWERKGKKRCTSQVPNLCEKEKNIYCLTYLSKCVHSTFPEHDPPWLMQTPFVFLQHSNCLYSFADVVRHHCLFHCELPAAWECSGLWWCWKSWNCVCLPGSRRRVRMMICVLYCKTASRFDFR